MTLSIVFDDEKTQAILAEMPETMIIWKVVWEEGGCIYAPFRRSTFLSCKYTMGQNLAKHGFYAYINKSDAEKLTDLQNSEAIGNMGIPGYICESFRIHKSHIKSMGKQCFELFNSARYPQNNFLCVVVSQMYYDPAQQYETAQEPQVEQAVEVMV